MSYILAPPASPVSYPISVANGGTGSTDKETAVITLTSPAFNGSAQSPDWGILPIPPIGSTDPTEIANVCNQLIVALQQLMVIS